MEFENEPELLKTPQKKLNIDTILQTPRRSSRKSIKPVNDYAQIVGIIKLENQDDAEVEQPRWTPSKVGRVSQKRGRRKTKKLKLNQTQNVNDGTISEEKIEAPTVSRPLTRKFSQKNKFEQGPKLLENDEMEELLSDASNLKVTTINNVSASLELQNVLNKSESDQQTLIKTPAVPQQLIASPPQKQPQKPNQQQLEVELKPIEKIEIELVGKAVIVTTASAEVSEVQPPSDLNITTASAEVSEVQPRSDLNITTASAELQPRSDLNITTASAEVSEVQPLSDLNFTIASAEVSEVQPRSDLNITTASTEVSEVQPRSDLNITAASAEESEVQPRSDMNITTANAELSEVEPQSLICCDDTSDCIIISPSLNETFELLQSEILDNSDCIIVSPIVNLTKTNFENDKCSEKSILQPAKKVAFDIELTPAVPTVPRMLVTEIENRTPVHRVKKLYRTPTPHKINPNLNIRNNRCLKKFPLTPEGNFSTFDAKQHGMRTRKRSLSACIDLCESSQKLQKRQQRVVTFSSPANQTALIDDLDLMIAKSFKKNVGNENNNVTQRRKRSISVDDKLFRPASKLPKPVMRTYTPNKMWQTPQNAPIIRRQMPNFAAIHQKSFNKMENLVDHVNRKAERAKILTSSSTKKLNPPTQKIGEKKKECVEVAKPSGRPKVVRKIELSKSVLGKPEKTAAVNNLLANESDKNDAELLNRLPDPCMGIFNAVPSVKQFTASSQSNQKKKPLKPTQLSHLPKPLFNLSTSLQPKHGFNAHDASIAPDKVGLRRQRHMDMFKGRDANRATRAKKNGEIIQGVRSNRRFELQMQHRRNLENN